MSGNGAPQGQPCAPPLAGRRYPLELALWLSPSFPVGSFAFSHALEWAAATGRIRDRSTAAAWLSDLLTNGSPANDAILLSAAWQGVRDRDDEILIEANELALALAASRERRLETSAQGNAFMTMLLAAWTNADLSRAREILRGEVAYPVAVAIASATHNLDRGPTLRTFVAASIANMTSALVRLSVIGQTDGQRIIASLMPAIETVAATAEISTLQDIGGAAFLSDIAAMAHETQDTRLFRT